MPSPTEGGTSTPRKPGLALDRLGLEGLGLGLGTPTRGPMSPTEEKPSPFAFDDDRHHGGPVLRPPAGMAPGPKGWSAMLEGMCHIFVLMASFVMLLTPPRVALRWPPHGTPCDHYPPSADPAIDCAIPDHEQHAGVNAPSHSPYQPVNKRQLDTYRWAA